jgi:hypothetical protein
MNFFATFAILILVGSTFLSVGAFDVETLDTMHAMGIRCSRTPVIKTGLIGVNVATLKKIDALCNSCPKRPALKTGIIGMTVANMKKLDAACAIHYTRCAC